ncbi:MAG: efflux RND transporter periplasmic adaptor subunit [Candidatus Omnitrophica bacterium]|nr:efflux RND transporter periplasmic adaptor subunit [Candidatus Omnitrophota bacterium]
MNKRNVVIAVCLLLVAGGCWFFFGKVNKKEIKYKRVNVVMGRIESAITSTGTVLPQNRLEVRPPISGRIEKILVEEGQKVKTGDILALMSSTDRAALMDAARLQGADAMKNWEDVYKPMPLIAPIDGDVIVKAVDPGQTVTQADAVIVLSDRLIVKAQVDETDIGKVKLGQEAVITLDAYPDIEARAKVDHVSYESKTVSNVTIYTVDIVPAQVPDVFRSGMSANVRIIQQSLDNVLVVPQKLVKNENGKNYVLVGQGRGKAPLSKEIQLGLSDGDNVQVISGLTAEDKILQVVAAGAASKGGAKGGSNPFMPTPPGGNRGGARSGGH